MPIPVGPGNRDIWTKIALDKLLDYSKQVNSDESKWSSDQIVTALMDDVDVLYPSWSTDWIEKELKHLENVRDITEMFAILQRPWLENNIIRWYIEDRLTDEEICTNIREATAEKYGEPFEATLDIVHEKIMQLKLAGKVEARDENIIGFTNDLREVYPNEPIED